ncbi:hypothetical protein Taro_050090 [Colocasia esculenta]|uniref:Uncharacterized protein n=1 Tax=Colocasia esculenta TaxID=4460 RepID=A0A843XCW3_COLES|nr:hypothetical protein [Colocasia esculenta]
MPTSVVVSDDEAEDGHLLSLVAAAEASALASKRRRISPFSTPARAWSGGGLGGGGAGGGVGTAAEEGSYTAALRGSRSTLWQQQQKQLQHGKHEDVKSVGGGYAAGVSASGARAVGSCFKCGQPGHWARDCAGEGGGYMEPMRDRVVDGGLGTEGDVIAKACPCGLGDCLVLTSNTARNPGRKFYRCPVKEENGGCNFFEWCKAVPASRNFPNNSPSVPELPCPCGAGSCLVLTAKTGKNVGQQFYRCPLDQEFKLKACC